MTTTRKEYSEKIEHAKQEYLMLKPDTSTQEQRDKAWKEYVDLIAEYDAEFVSTPVQ